MKHDGMTDIVKNTTRIIAGFIVVFGVYIAVTGHLSPGGGFAGGVILAAGAVLIVLAFGRHDTGELLTEAKCHVWDAAGAMGFLIIALLGFLAGSFFLNFLNVVTGENVPQHWNKLMSGGTIPLSNLAILVKVGAGLTGAFLALSAFRRTTWKKEINP